MGHSRTPESLRRTCLTEPLSDPLGGIAASPVTARVTATRHMAVVSRTRVVERVEPRLPRKLVADPARERAIHEELVRERAATAWGGVKPLFGLALVVAIWARYVLALGPTESAMAFAALFPLAALARALLGFAASLLPAFNERMACMVIVATVVGAGAFSLFFEDGTMGRLYAGGHPREGRPAR